MNYLIIDSYHRLSLFLSYERFRKKNNNTFITYSVSYYLLLLILGYKVIKIIPQKKSPKITIGANEFIVEKNYFWNVEKIKKYKHCLNNLFKSCKSTANNFFVFNSNFGFSSILKNFLSFKTFYIEANNLNGKYYMSTKGTNSHIKIENLLKLDYINILCGKRINLNYFFKTFSKLFVLFNYIECRVCDRFVLINHDSWLTSTFTKYYFCIISKFLKPDINVRKKNLLIIHQIENDTNLICHYDGNFESFLKKIISHYHAKYNIFLKIHPKLKNFDPIIKYLRKYTINLHDKKNNLDFYHKFCTINSNFGLELLSSGYNVRVYGKSCYEGFDQKKALTFINFLKRNSF